MAFADSQGTRIYYDDRGKGEPVLLCLSGWCVHHTIFLPLAERLSAQHRVLAMVSRITLAFCPWAAMEFVVCYEDHDIRDQSRG
jgi:hypothetical protein